MIEENPQLSVVIPVYRNKETLDALHSRLCQVLQNEKIDYEIIFINDACPDGSLARLEEISRRDKKTLIAVLEKNIGQGKAVLKGLALSRGETIIVMDADLQDPPEAIPLLMAKLKGGFDLVFAGRRGAYESRFRLLTSYLFKRSLYVLCGLPVDAGLFVAMNRRMVQRLLFYHQPGPSILAMIACTGLSLVSIPVERAKRLRGVSAYSFWKRFKVGFGGVIWVIYQKLLISRKIS